MKNLHWLLIGCALPLFFFAAGCGPGRGDLSGKVVFEQKALAVGSVIVKGSDGVVKSGEIQPNGTYEVKDIAAGTIQITVTSLDPGEQKVYPRKKDAVIPPPKDRSKWFPIPEQYGGFDKAPLTYELKAGPNTWDIELK